MNIKFEQPCAEPETCQTCSARTFGVCRALTASQLAHISHFTDHKTIRRGEVISFDDDRVFSFANIISGTVKLTKILADGRQQIVGLQFAPEFVGRPFVEKAHITAEAASEVKLCILPRGKVEWFLQKSPQFEHLLLEQTLKQLDEARDWMVTLGRKTASEKFASFLLMLDHHIGHDLEGQPGLREFQLPLTRYETADFLGLTIETVSRQITRFRKAGLIELRHNNYFVVLNMAKIQSVSGD